VAIVFGVKRDTTTLSGKCSDEIGICYRCILELLPEQSTPTALLVVRKYFLVELGKRTGEPVILSPSSLIRTVTERTGRAMLSIANRCKTFENIVTRIPKNTVLIFEIALAEYKEEGTALSKASLEN
jgi:hypothetical protein